MHVNRGDLAERGFCLGAWVGCACTSLQLWKSPSPSAAATHGLGHPEQQVLTVAKRSPQAGPAGHREGTRRSQHSLTDSSPSLTPKGGAKAPEDPHSAVILTDSLEETPNLGSSTTWKFLVQGTWQRTRATYLGLEPPERKALAPWSASLAPKPQAALHCGRHFGSQDKRDKQGRILPDPQMPGQKPGEATIKTHHLSPPLRGIAKLLSRGQEQLSTVLFSTKNMVLEKVHTVLKTSPLLNG